MPLSIIQRPQSGKLSSTPNTTYSITEAVTPTRVLIDGGSGISFGDLLYIHETYSSYQGFWFAGEVAGSGFILTRWDNQLEASYAVYSRDQANVSIYVSSYEVNASCVHLPINYTLRSEKWPSNIESTDFDTGIIAYDNDNGFLKLILFSATTPVLNEGDYIIIKNSDIDFGPVQIITKHSTSIYTVDIPYASTVDTPYFFTGASIQKYYNNYFVKVQIYGGLNAAHVWESLNPYELIAELLIAPDADNMVTFSIADILKEKIQLLKNRPNYDSEPYDLDRFCEFYIMYAEQYDSSDGVEITTYTSAYVDDSTEFEGMAVDTKLPFKNIYSGFLSEYMPDDSAASTAKFLSDGSPMFWPGYYFDISILFAYTVGITLDQLITTTIYYDEHGNLLDSGFTSLDFAGYENSPGVIRVPVTATPPDGAAYFTVKMDVEGEETSWTFSETKRIDINTDCNDPSIYITWKNYLGGFNYWLFRGNKAYGIDIGETQQRDLNIFTNWPNSYGENADSITQETYRTSKNKITVRAENLTEDQAEFVAGLKVSSLVQIMVSKYDRRTVLVDTTSFIKREDNQKLVSLTFDILYTDNLPSQSL